jgi:2-isopropylmalate synthase
MLEKIGELISLAKEKCECVEFVANDAFRAEEGFAVQCAKTAFEAGACAITLCDDAGVAFPEEFANIVVTHREIYDIMNNKAIEINRSKERNLLC